MMVERKDFIKVGNGLRNFFLLFQVHIAIKGTGNLTTYMVYPPTSGHYAVYTFRNWKDREDPIDVNLQKVRTLTECCHCWCQKFL